MAFDFGSHESTVIKGYQNLLIKTNMPKVVERRKCIDCPALVKGQRVRCKPCQHDNLVKRSKTYKKKPKKIL
jgi:hypothetical protein